MVQTCDGMVTGSVTGTSVTEPSTLQLPLSRP